LTVALKRIGRRGRSKLFLRSKELFIYVVLVVSKLAGVFKVNKYDKEDREIILNVTL
jgi:hypothetical protein